MSVSFSYLMQLQELEISEGENTDPQTSKLPYVAEIISGDINCVSKLVSYFLVSRKFETGYRGLNNSYDGHIFLLCPVR